LRPAIALIATIIAAHVIEFLGGLRVFPVTVYLFPAVLVPQLLTLVIVPWLAVTLIPVRRPRVILRGIGSIAIAFVLWAICIFAFRIPSFLLGLIWQVRRVATTGQVESAAQKCLQLLPNGGEVKGPNAFARETYDDERWHQIKDYAFVRLADNDCVIYVDPPRVEFAWGGALMGHTGIRYSGDGNLSQSRDYRLIRWNPKVAFYQRS
jgi:hypothetical protein